LGGVPKTCRVLDSQVRRQRPAALREGEQSRRSRLLNEKHLLGNQRFASADAATLGLSGNRRGQDAGGMERAGVRDGLGRTAMPAYVFGSWVFGYASLVPRLGKPIRNGRRRKKTPRPAGRCPRSTTGPLTKATSSSAAPAVACGCARQPRTPCCCMRHFGAACLRDGKSQFSWEPGKFHAVTFFTFQKGHGRQCGNRLPRSGHQGQCQIPSRAASQRMQSNRSKTL
jgi:hypothetical protein